MPFVTVTALSHPGLMRDHNEDSMAVGPWTLCGTVTENPQTLGFALGYPLVVAVADGMGGPPAGEVASSLVVRHLAALGPTLDSEQAVRDALNVCNQAVYTAAERDPDLTAMGTTVAGVVVLAREVLVFNVGDSRVLDVTSTRETLHRISVDDSPPLAPGRRTTSVVTQALGGASRFSAITPHVSREPLTTGERYLVCTDGLTDPVPEDALDTVLRAHDGGRAAFELWKSAIEAGGPDNITLALIGIADEASSLSGGGADAPTQRGGQA
ncbi:PP2C family serine/threonine-protein phosphatase [Streptomyces sp. NPDC048430]|uniref:PP2C family protein-serine/threonine phosphatase n=1 Tax=unclassified Streptomyces TaxID=2593676 RepID=UPI00342627FA